MNSQIEINIPDMEEDEPSMTEKQDQFIQRLLGDIEGQDLKLKTNHLGKWQASALIDQLIECRDAGIKLEINNDNSSKSVSFLLGFGIVLCPYIFCWMTLSKGYSLKSRAVSFGWLALVILILMPKT